MSQIKINRAMRLAQIGAHPQSASAMLNAIPAELIAQLSSRHIADIMDAAWTVAQASKAIADADALANGFVWSDRHQQSFDLVRG